MNFKKIKTYEDIILFNRESLGDNAILSEDRMREHKTELFKTFIKKNDVIYFRMRELDLHSRKCIFKLCSINTLGSVVVEQNYKTKKELQEDFNKLKIEQWD